MEYERPEVRADEDANDNVAIVVHCKQHDEIGNGKLDHVQQRPGSLFQYTRPEPLGLRCALTRWSGTRRRGWLIAVVPRCAGFESGSRGVLLDEISIILLDGAAHELQRHGQQEDADARAGKHAGGGVVP